MTKASRRALLPFGLIVGAMGIVWGLTWLAQIYPEATKYLLSGIALLAGLMLVTIAVFGRQP